MYVIGFSDRRIFRSVFSDRLNQSASPDAFIVSGFDGIQIDTRDFSPFFETVISAVDGYSLFLIHFQNSPFKTANLPPTAYRCIHRCLPSAVMQAVQSARVQNLTCFRRIRLYPPRHQKYNACFRFCRCKSLYGQSLSEQFSDLCRNTCIQIPLFCPKQLY